MTVLEAVAVEWRHGLPACPRCEGGQLLRVWPHSAGLQCLQCGWEPSEPITIEPLGDNGERPWEDTLPGGSPPPPVTEAQALALYTAWRVRCIELADFADWYTSARVPGKGGYESLALRHLCEETEPSHCAECRLAGRCVRARVLVSAS